MKSSISLTNAIKEFEGLRLTAYRCKGGVLTIGYGHTRGVREGDKISLWQARSYLKDDILECEREVDGLELELTQGQYDALVDFVFNLGIGNLRSSTLLKLIRQGASMEQIQAQFKQWVYSGTERLPGLVRRREWEADRWSELV